MPQDKDEKSVKLTYSSIVSAGGKPVVAITFERGADVAEGTVPEGKIEAAEDFPRKKCSNCLHIWFRIRSRSCRKPERYPHWDICFPEFDSKTEYRYRQKPDGVMQSGFFTCALHRADSRFYLTFL